MYTFVVKTKELRAALQKYLESKGVMSKVYFFPIHEKTIYKKNTKEDIVLPVTKDLSERSLNVPLYPHMSDDEIDLLVGSIEEFFSAEVQK